MHIYINQGEPYQAVITSANFTIKGLRLNHETGVVIADKEILQGMEEYIEDTALNGSTWFFTSVKGMSVKKREHYNSRISAVEKIKILFTVDNVIAYSAEIMQAIQMRNRHCAPKVEENLWFLRRKAENLD